MVKNIFTAQKKANKVLTRIIIFSVLVVITNISYSCFKKNEPSPVYAEIPDVNFKAYLKTIVPLSFTPDGKFISNHPSVVSYNELMSINRKDITSLSGIQYFTSLKKLHCSDNKITNLDLSKNLALEEIDCSYNGLTKLDLGKNLNLIRLECYRNKLISIDVSFNTKLEWLNCYNNQLNNLDVSKNEALKRIYCSFNQIKTLDLNKNVNLTTLECYRNDLTTLIINKETKSLKLYIDNSIKCCHPSIKAFKDRGGDLFDSYYQEIPSFVCK